MSSRRPGLLPFRHVNNDPRKRIQPYCSGFRHLSRCVFQNTLKNVKSCGTCNRIPLIKSPGGYSRALAQIVSRPKKTTESEEREKERARAREKEQQSLLLALRILEKLLFYEITGIPFPSMKLIRRKQKKERDQFDYIAGEKQHS